ncbi:GAF domain-containing protein [Paenibacillus turicensis]|uniref:GAF domain-containing protein n=1 Tax=Paenibacillus turicensis TaxID=160487 RepID=UPI003D2AB959
MFQPKQPTAGSRQEQYQAILSQLNALIEDELNPIANLSNAAALLNFHLTEINWVGFYLNVENELVLGPFQGLPACVRIPMGKGVCGTAAQQKTTLRVADVHQFPGHIACDAASNSEIVIPIFVQDQLFGVLDIDSPNKNRFDEVDQEQLEQFVEALSQHLSPVVFPS